MATKNNFKADIIKEEGKIAYSNTQELRVLQVRDPDNGIKISCQKWWRTSVDEEWSAGKGFFLSGRDAHELGKLLQSAGESILHVKN